MLIEGTVALLNANAQVTSICGNSIMPIPAPDDLSDYPAIVYQVASDVSTYSFTNPTVINSRVVFNCIAQEYGTARTLALTVKEIFSGYRGRLPDGTLVFMTQIVNMVDGFVGGPRLSTISVHALYTYSD